jgi:hypothetical protein
VLPDQIDQSLNRFDLRNIELHGLFTDIEIHFSGSAADIAEVGVGHLTRTIYNAAHDGDTNTLEVSCGGLDAGRGFLKVEEGTTAGGAGNIVGLENADPCGLKDVVGKAQGLTGGLLASKQNGITNPVAKE